MALTRSEITARYDAKNSKTYSFKFNRKTDAEIIEKLDNVESRNGYIKRLIREDLARTRPGSAPDSAPKTEMEETHMKTYHIKPEFFDIWFGKNSPDPDYVVTQDELENLSREWETPVPELLEQLDEID